MNKEEVISMKCPTTDKLSQYVDEILSETELSEIKQHLSNCHECHYVVETFRGETEFLKETLQTPTLPDTFATGVLNQLEPYEQKSIHHNKKIVKRIMLSAVGVLLVLAIGISTTFNPAFAEWLGLGGLFTTNTVDEGLKIASEAGLAKRVNQKVTNNGITFKVEDIIEDSFRIALSYQVLDQNGKSTWDWEDLDLFNGNNTIFVVGPDGKKIDNMGMSLSSRGDYGLFEFSPPSGQKQLDGVKIKFQLTELHGVKGNWNLEIPIDLKKSNKLTGIQSLNHTSTSQHGVKIDLKEVRFSTASTDLFYTTKFTQQEQLEANIKKLKKKFGKEISDSTIYTTAISYHIENENGKTVYYHSGVPSFHSDPNFLGGSGNNSDSFVPQKEKSKLTFVLDAVIKTEPSNFSIKIKPKELNSRPVSFEYKGNFFTIKRAEIVNDYSLRQTPKPALQIYMEGGIEDHSSELGNWALIDHKGKVYNTFQNGFFREKDANGRKMASIVLKSIELTEIPEELTLHLLSETNLYELKEKWKVPLH